MEEVRIKGELRYVRVTPRHGRPYFLIPDGNGDILIIRRGHEPFQGMWCFPGGMVDPGETVSDAAIREVREETGLEVTLDRVLGIYSATGRDPRGHFISIAFVAHPCHTAPKITEEATAWTRKDPRGTVEMAFDHARILADLGRQAGKGAPPIIA